MLGRRMVAAAQNRSSEGVCGQGRGRTADLTIFSRALYQLSYLTGGVLTERSTAGVTGRCSGADGI
jgi:hypothetical protein